MGCGKMNNDVVYWIWLAEQCGYGSKYFTKLYSLYRDPEEVYNLENEEVMQLGRKFSYNFKDRLCQRDLTKARAIYDYCNKYGIEVISFDDVRYPERLRLIEDPPVVLYSLGEFPDFNNKLCIGIVGTRKMSRYGRAAAYKFSYELSAMGVCVVSGLALGVDAAAACGALDGGEPTAQILGCGVSIVYPKAHSTLRSEVIKHGALISEYPPLEDPKKYYFPQRNRIISGISHGVFVTECRKESGAMITASMALAQGKDLFAFPGNVGEPTAEGPNELLRGGAYAAISSEDITSHYKLFFDDSDSRANAAKLKAARERATDVLDAIKRYKIPDKCEENERINSAPLVGAKYDSKGAKMGVYDTLPRIEQLEMAIDGEEAPPVEIAEARESGSAPTSTAKDYGLDEKTATVFEAIPCNSPVSVDKIVCDGLSAQDVITALTMLEIMGLVSSLPGGLYIRK